MSQTKDLIIASEDAQDARRELNKTLADIVGITTFGYKYRAALKLERKEKKHLEKSRL